jgi:phosphoribosylformimino-5-aminoimidazole carboxamide ribotide isomerase
LEGCNLKIFPSIDIKNGRCVKLTRGKPGTGREISNDPLEIALTWEKRGANVLHIIDLDAAIQGGKGNRELIKTIIRKLSIPVEVGGGIRSIADAEDILKAGARWVIFGTAAFKNPSLIVEAAEKFGSEKIIVAVDSSKGKVVVEGWKSSIELSPVEALRIFDKTGVYAFLYTDVEVEGTLEGVRLRNVRRLVNFSKTPIIYAGGVASFKDLVMLKKAGVMAVVIGRALYDGLFNFEEVKKLVEDA